MNKNRRKALVAALAASLAVSGPGAPWLPLALAAVPQTITYQGSLKQNGLVVNGVQSMVFNLYATPAGGAVLWTSGPMSVAVSTGVFQVLLQLANVDWENTNPWLETVVAGTALSPRQQLTTVPYSLDALMVSGKRYTSAASAPASPGAGDLWLNTGTGALSYWSGTTWGLAAGQGIVAGTMTVVGGAFSVGGSSLVVVNGGVGVGTTGPGYKLDVQGGQVNASGGLCIAGACQTSWTGGNTPWAAAGSVVDLTAPGNNVVVQSTLTVQGNAFSVGTSSFVVIGSSVGVRTTNPIYALDVPNDTARFKQVNIDSLGGAMNMGGAGLLQVGDVGNNNNALALRANSAEVMRATGGNVGVGTTSPAAKLDVTGGYSRALDNGSNNSPGSGMGLESFALAGDSYLQSYDRTLAAWRRLYVRGNPVVMDMGNVGIGTTSPGANLDVAGGTGGNVFAVRNPGDSASYGVVIKPRGAGYAGAEIQGTNYNLGGTPPLLLNPEGGNVGVGTTGPGYKLDVQGGQVNASGGLCIAGACQTSWTGGNTPWTAAGSVVDLTAPGNNIVVQSTLTVQGNAFSVGGSTLVVTQGNVGIGTTNPQALLQVGSGGVSSVPALYVFNNIGGANVSLANAGTFVSWNHFNGNGETDFFNHQGGGSPGGFAFFNANSAGVIISTPMYMSGNGNVGVGTTSPANSLHVVGSGGTNNVAGRLDVSNTGGIGFGSSLVVENTNSTVNNTTGIMGYNSGGAAVAGLEFINMNHGGPGTRQGALSLFTINTGDIASRLYMSNTGNVGIGTTSPQKVLDVNGNMVVGLDAQYAISTRISGGAIKPVFATNGNTMYFYDAGGTATVFRNGADTTELMRITDGGNVGIGTTNPATKLHMNSGTLTIDGNASTGLQVYGSTFVVGSNGVVSVGTTNPSPIRSLDVRQSAPWQQGAFFGDAAGGIEISDQNDLPVGDIVGLTATNSGYVPIQLRTGNSPSVFLPTSGNVGIGTTNPGYLLDVQGTTAPLLRLQNTSAGADSWISVESAGATVRTQLTSNVSGGYVGGVTGTVTNHPFTLRTNNSERVRIDTAGNVGIGTTNPGALLAVNGTAGNPTGVWSTVSDERLKKNIGDLKGALPRLLKLRGVTFEWKDPKEHGDMNGPQMGFIAQDVEKTFPEWVGVGQDGYKMITPTGINAVLIEAIKEQQAEIEDLKKELRESKAK